MKNNQLRILMLCEYFYPFDRGGTEWSVFFLAKGLKSKGCTVEILTPNFGTVNRENYSEIPVYRFPFYKHLKNPKDTVTPFFFSNILWFILSFIFLIYEITKFKPTHIHVQGKYFLPAAVLTGKIFRIPVIATLRDYIVLCPYAYCINKYNHFQACSFTEIVSDDLVTYIKLKKNPGIFLYLFGLVAAIRGWFISLLLRFFMKHVDKIIAISRKLAKIYRSNHIRIDQVIYNTSILNHKANLTKPRYFVYAGRLTKGKGIDNLVKAYINLYTKRKIPDLYVLGEGPLKKELMSLGCGNIKYLGQLSYRVSQKYLTQAIAVIVPSVWEEPFGRIALEALNNGIPVLATDRGALPEIVKKDITGIIVQPTTKDLEKGIEKILHYHLKLRENIIKIREEIIKKFSSDPVKDYINLYNSL